MKIFRAFLISVGCLAIALFAFRSTSAQMRLPRPSQAASVTQTIGVTDIIINYSRPGVKGRTIFADAPTPMGSRTKGEGTLDNQNQRLKGEPIVPYGHVWRAGANEATQFSVSDNVTINGKPLAAGSYSLHAIPGKSEWTIIFNSVANQWGSFSYDSSKDALRIAVKPQPLSESQEWLAYTIEPSSENAATVSLRWEKIAVPFTVTVDVPAVTMARVRQAVAAAKADDWRTPYDAALYARQNQRTEESKAWLDASLKAADTSIASAPNFKNLSGKANILIAIGRLDEAFAVADKALAAGKAEKADTAAFEKRIADLKSKGT